MFEDQINLKHNKCKRIEGLAIKVIVLCSVKGKAKSDNVISFSRRFCPRVTSDIFCCIEILIIFHNPCN